MNKSSTICLKKCYRFFVLKTKKMSLNIYKINEPKGANKNQVLLYM